MPTRRRPSQGKWRKGISRDNETGTMGTREQRVFIALDNGELVPVVVADVRRLQEHRTISEKIAIVKVARMLGKGGKAHAAAIQTLKKLGVRTKGVSGTLPGGGTTPPPWLRPKQ